MGESLTCSLLPLGETPVLPPALPWPEQQRSHPGPPGARVPAGEVRASISLFHQRPPEGFLLVQLVHFAHSHSSGDRIQLCYTSPGHKHLLP